VPAVATHPRQLAFDVLREISKKDAYADVALDRHLNRSQLSPRDRALATELVYGCVRRRRTLDAIIDRLAKKPAAQQAPDVRLLLHLGLYQLAFSDRIPPSAAVDTTVELAKANRVSGLAGLINGILRQYHRTHPDAPPDFAELDDPIARLGTQLSFPDWIVAQWVDQLGNEEARQLGETFDQVPPIHLRVNRLKISRDEQLAQFTAAGIAAIALDPLPDAIHLTGSPGNVVLLPGYAEGNWTVQDGSAQLVTYLLDPQPGDTVIDACAAPGGKATHAAELMDDRGTVWACDCTPSRLKKVAHSVARLGLNSVNALAADSRELTRFQGQADRVLVDAPCSGLGTLHRRADLRWRQTQENAIELATLQRELLDTAATWVKPQGVLVYATCTIHAPENEVIVRSFLARHPGWAIEPPAVDNPAYALWDAQANPEGWLKVFPQRSQMDGFFMVRFVRQA